jgi:Malectin domain
LIASKLDLIARAGANSAYTLQVTVPVVGEAVVALETVVQNPFLSAAEFIYLGPAVPIAPTPAPIAMPVTAPAVVPVFVPVAVPSAPGPFQDLLINCGSTAAFLEASGVRTWRADQYFNNTGGIYNVNAGTEISNTLDDRIYRSERNGNFQYEIPVPPGDYEIKIHLSEVSDRTICGLFVEKWTKVEC